MRPSRRENPPLPSVPAAEAPTLIPKHGNGILRPFRPGQSGNPSGRGGEYHEIQRICRAASPAAARRMVELMQSADERIALMAAEKVLERGWGKPREARDADIPDAETVARREASRAAVVELLQMMAVPEPMLPRSAPINRAIAAHQSSSQTAAEHEPPSPSGWPT